MRSRVLYFRNKNEMATHAACHYSVIHDYIFLMAYKSFISRWAASESGKYYRVRAPCCLLQDISATYRDARLSLTTAGVSRVLE